MILSIYIDPSNAVLNPTCHLLALLGAHPILHISRIRVNTVGRKMSSCVLWMEGMRASRHAFSVGAIPARNAQHISTQIMHKNLCWVFSNPLTFCPNKTEGSTLLQRKIITRHDFDKLHTSLDHTTYIHQSHLNVIILQPTFASRSNHFLSPH